MNNLGRDYIVWDKASTVDFVNPSRGTVHAELKLDEAMLADIRASTATGEKHLPQYHTVVRDDQGTVVARVGKLYLSVVNQKRSLLTLQSRTSICTQI